MLQKVKAWLIKQLSTPEKIATPVHSMGITDQIEHEGAQNVVRYDERLLERSRTQWQFGDWQSQARQVRATMKYHPVRAKLALLPAVGLSATGNAMEARKYTPPVLEWGCRKKLVRQILIAGVHNILGRAAAVSRQGRCALQHFQGSLQLGAPHNDVRLLSRAGVTQQLSQRGLCAPSPQNIGVRNLPNSFGARLNLPDITP
jgi:hypothetical protein